MSGKPMTKLHLFEGYGVEMEYMIVSKRDLVVKPIVDKFFKDVAGEYVSDIEKGRIAWSNELVSHVVEIKTNGPAKSLKGLSALFHENVLEINKLLAPYDAMMLPSGAHPLMDPYKETVIWPHENNEIYNLYNRIFDCRGHGWSNLQSTHINLPFANDDEFARLHAAVRVILPLIPALSASTPFLDGQFTGFIDARLESYRHNQEKIPSIAGKVIPEQLFTQNDYDVNVFKRIRRDIASYDTEGVLDQYFLNSRGAIARFDRGAIEIRIIDIQECPAADIAILSLVTEVLKKLVNEEWSSFEVQKSWHEDPLAELFLGVIEKGTSYEIANIEYPALFNMSKKEMTAREFWKNILSQVGNEVPAEAAKIVEAGNLSERILKTLGRNPQKAGIESTYKTLADCLAKNELFLPASP